MGFIRTKIDNIRTIDNKQTTLVSGTSIKTINGIDILGTGNINIVSDVSMKADISYVDTKIGNLIGMAPSNLDTLKEIADRLTSDSGAVSTLTSVVSTKVDKITGKGLSTEDYTTSEKNKLSGISVGANNYVLPIASSSTLGGVKAGTNITIDASGVISSSTLTSVSWSEITSKPTTLSGYGITDSIQNTLVSGTSIKTINGTSVLGSGNIVISDSTKLPLAGGIMTGAITAIRETKVVMSANDINLASGNLFTKTITIATTFTVSGVLPSPAANSFMLELTNGGAATVTWWSGVKWAGGTAPTLTTAGVDILGFYSHDGGTTWRGMVMAKDSK